MSVLESSNEIFAEGDQSVPNQQNESSSLPTTDTSSHSSLGASLSTCDCDDVTSNLSRTMSTQSEQLPTQSADQTKYVANIQTKRSLSLFSSSATQGQLILHARPKGTPERSHKEQKKRLREYEKMVEASRKRDLEKTLNERERLEHKDQEQEELQKLWLEQILPQWCDKLRHSKRVQDAWWRGLPPKVRGDVWKLCLPNDLNITEDLYAIFLEHAKKKLQIHDSVFSQKVESDTDVPLHLLQTLKGREDTLESIKYDIARTFPTLAIFNEGGPYYELLHNLLGAYTCFRPDIGYVQGMSYIAALFILNLDEYDAFMCLANLLNRPILQAFFRVDDRRMNSFFLGFDLLLASFFPKVADKLNLLGMTSNFYMLDWVFTLFSKPFDLDVACRLWDVFFRDGDLFIYRTALGILRMLQDELLSINEFIDAAQLFSRIPAKYNNQVILFENISKISITMKQVDQALTTAEKEFGKNVF